jgi:hypothetical protein
MTPFHGRSASRMRDIGNSNLGILDGIQRLSAAFDGALVAAHRQARAWLNSQFQISRHGLAAGDVDDVDAQAG